MKKSRFVKAIAAFTMSAVATAGCISLVACGGHTHSTTKGWQGKNETQHWYICDEDGVAYGHQNHNWGDDDICDDCNYDRSDPNSGSSDDPNSDDSDDSDPGSGGEQSGDTDYDAFIGEGNVIYRNTFNTAAEVPFVAASEVENGTGVYGSVNNNATAFTDTNKVVIAGDTEEAANKQLRAIDTETSNTTSAYIRTDAVSYKTVKIYAKVNPTTAAGKWTHVAFLDGNGNVFAQVRTNKDKQIQVFGAANGDYGVGENIACDGSEYKLEATLDLVTGKIAVSINGTAATTFETSGAEFTSTSFSGIKIATASGERSIYIDNVAIKTEEPETAALKEALDAELDAHYAELTATDGAYTEANKALLDEKYEAGVAAIAAAENNGAVITAYKAAVAELDGVETVADAALKEYKEEKKTELENSYNSSDYVINKEQFDTTLAAEKAKIDAATSTAKVDEAFTAAKTALDAVKTDVQQIAADKEAAGNELAAYKGGNVNYSFEGVTGYENKADYETAIANGNQAITAATTQGEIATALANAKSAIDGIEDNATILAKAKAAAETDIGDYKADDIAGLSDDGRASAAAAKAACMDAITSATTPTAVFSAVNSSKTTIDGIVNAEKMSLDDYKAQQKSALQTYAEAEIAKLDTTADATLITAINQAVTDGDAAIDAVAADETANATVLEKFNDAKAAIDTLVANDQLAKYKAEKVNALGGYASAKKAEIHNNAAYSAQIDDAVTAGTTAINAAEVTDTAAVDTAYTNATAAIDDLVAECKASEVTITLENSGLEALKVTFGTAPEQPNETPVAEDKKFKGWYADADCTEEYTWETVLYDDVTVYAGWILPDVTVTLSVNDAEWDSVKVYSTDSPADLVLSTPYVSCKIFSEWHVNSVDGTEWSEWAASNSWTENQNVTLYAEFTDKTDEDYSLSESWTIGATDTSFADNNLFVATTLETEGTYGATATAATINEKTFSAGYHVNVNKGSSNKATPVQFVAKENIILTLYVGLAASNGKDTRQGTIYCAVNGVEEEIANATTRTRLLAYKELVLNAGDVVELYINVQSDAEYSAHMWLFGAEAEISDSVTNATVVYHGYEDGDHSTPWLSIKPVTAPEENPSKTDSSFVGWSATENSAVADYVFDENAKVEAGETLNLYPVYQTADVTVNFYGEDKTTLIATKGAVSGNVFNDFPATPTKEGWNFIGWYDMTTAAAYDFTQALSAGTINVYAYFEEKAEQIVWLFTDEATTVNSATISGCDGLITIAASGSKLNNKAVVEEVDGTTTSNILVTSGSSKTVTVASGAKAVKVTMYMSITNSGATSVTSGNITVTGATTGNGDFAVDANDDTKKIVAVEFTLNANTTASITQSVSKYLAIYKIVVEEI